MKYLFTLLFSILSFFANAQNVSSDTLSAESLENSFNAINKRLYEKLLPETKGKSLEELLAVAGSNGAVRNNGGGHFNHSLFWSTRRFMMRLVNLVGIGMMRVLIVITPTQSLIK